MATTKVSNGRPAIKPTKEGTRRPTRPRPKALPAANVLQPRAVNSAAANHVPKATKASTAAANLGNTKATNIQKAATSWDKPAKAKGAKGRPPPAMTASFCMGVQKRPVTKQGSQKAANTAHFELLEDAARVDAAIAAVSAAEASSAAAIVAARGSLKKGSKEPKKAGAQAMRAAARIVATRVALIRATREAARTQAAQQQVQSYTQAWEAIVSNSWSSDTVPVGHKLRQLCRSCGMELSEEAFSAVFASLGGVGTEVKLDTFLSVMVSNRPMPEQAEVGSNERYRTHSSSPSKARTLRRPSPDRVPCAPQDVGKGLTSEMSRLRLDEDAELHWYAFRALVHDEHAGEHRFRLKAPSASTLSQ